MFPVSVPVAGSREPSVQTFVGKRYSGPNVFSTANAVAIFTFDAGLNVIFDPISTTFVPSIFCTRIPVYPGISTSASVEIDELAWTAVTGETLEVFLTRSVESELSAE